MNRFILYTSINPKDVGKSLANIRRWQEYADVQSVRLVQSDREFIEISGHVRGLSGIDIINTHNIDGCGTSGDNPKGLPSLKELLVSMRGESLTQRSDTMFGYLNSDIIIGDRSFFDELSEVDGYVVLLHRRDVLQTERGIEDKGFYMHGVDGFFMNCLMLEHIRYGCSDRFYLGLPGWDQYFPLMCWLNSWKQSYITSRFMIHKMHSTSNPGNYGLFASRLIFVYMFEYYLKMHLSQAHVIPDIVRFVQKNGWITSVMHKIVVFTALRSLGWKITRRGN